MGNFKQINGVKWYYRLKPSTENNKSNFGLFSDHPRHELRNNLIVRWSYLDRRQNKMFLLYAMFKSYLEFGIYQLKLPQEQRCFFEIILGETPQKPHFDIDISDMSVDKNQVLELLVDNIIKVLKDKGIELNLSEDVLIYSSHGEKKYSYHLIINNYCHTNNIEAKAFYHKVVKNISDEWRDFIDSAVYSPTQQFRIVGNQKINTTRVKTLSKTWLFHEERIEYRFPEEPDSPEHEMVMELEASIIGFVGNCKFLPPFEPAPDQIKHYIESDDLNIEDAKSAIGLVGKKGNISITDSRFPYKFLGINGPIVMLKRIKPSKCKICSRVHRNENPYLLVVGEEKSVYFHCRRAPENKKLFLGKLNPSAEISDKMENNEPTEETEVNKVKINWTKNVLERVNKIARSGNSNDKKFITSDTQIDPKYKQDLINLYIKNA